MLTPKEAYFRFKAEHQKLEVKEAGLYKSKFYIFVAPKVDGGDYNDPFYCIDAKTGRAVKFHPMDDLQGFQEAMAKHRVDWR